MPEEWFDVAYINFDEAILHGRMRDDTAEHRVLRNVRVTLNEEQKRSIEDLNSRHQHEMNKLLRTMVEQEPTP